MHASQLVGLLISLLRFETSDWGQMGGLTASAPVSRSTCLKGHDIHALITGSELLRRPSSTGRLVDIMRLNMLVLNLPWSCGQYIKSRRNGHL